MIDLSGRVALVTGGARGIGRATAVRLAGAGADVVVNYRTSKSAAREVALEVRRLGRRSATVKADVAEPDDVAAMAEFVGDRFGRLDVLVSNAAGGGFRPLLETTERQFDAAMHTNARALLTLVRAALPLFGRGGGRGKVVALSSHGSHRALPHYGLVGASKAALESLVRHLALELGGRGLNFNIVLAGLVETDAIRGLPGAAELARAAGERMLVPERRLSPGDVADAVVFLSSGLSDAIQGQTVVVDGGAALHG
jgi:enoyl-[acyl-carrier protein] reductase III